MTVAALVALTSSYYDMFMQWRHAGRVNGAQLQPAHGGAVEGECAGLRLELEPEPARSRNTPHQRHSSGLRHFRMRVGL